MLGVLDAELGRSDRLVPKLNHRLAVKGNILLVDGNLARAKLKPC